MNSGERLKIIIMGKTVLQVDNKELFTFIKVNSI